MSKRENQQRKSQAARSLAPKPFENLKVRRLSPSSFRLEGIAKRTRIKSPVLPSAETNFDRLLDHLKHTGQTGLIQGWRQSIEETESLAAGRSPRSINDQEGLQDFRNAILSMGRHSDSSMALLHRLLPSHRSPVITKRKQDSDFEVGTEAKRWLDVWNLKNGRRLSPEQKSILRELQDKRQQLNNLPLKDLHDASSPIATELRKEYGIVICHAIRNGLQDHPWCLEWIVLRQNFQDRKALHRLYRTFHLEHGIERPIKVKKEKTEEHRLLEEIRTLRIQKPNLSLRSIHKILRERQSCKKPWSTFQKWISDPLRREMIDPTDPIVLEEQV